MRAIGALALLATLAGCSFGTMDMTGPESASGTFTLQGRAYGGSNPDQGATIQVWAAGTSGYGAGATALGSSTTTDGNGFFNLTGKYSCTSVTSPVYITATGGNPGVGSANSAIRFVAAIGSCASLQSASYVWMNEVTTAAAAYALTQYSTTGTAGLSASDAIGAPNTTQAQQGLTNAFATVGNLVNLTNGTAQTSIPITNTLGTITATPEFNKLYTVADIIASCANTTGGTSSNCSTFFSTVTPGGGTTPADTWQGAVMLNLNPTSNAATLWGLENANSPFVSNGLTAAPNDWTLGIQYSAGTAANTLLDGVNAIATDSNGNVWVVNYDSSNVTKESMTELSPTGTPLANPFNSGATSPASMASSSPRNISIDASNDVFGATSSGSGYVFEYSAAGTSSSLGVAGQPYDVAFDASGNMWVAQNSTSAAAGLVEFTGGVLAQSNEVSYPKNGGTGNSNPNEFIKIATDGTPWLADGTSTNQAYTATGMNPGTCTTYPCTTTNDTSLTATYTSVASAATLSTPSRMAPGTNGSMWMVNNGNNTLSLFSSPTTSTTVGGATSLTGPRDVAVDGAGNAWVANRTTGLVSEFSATGTVRSPVGTTAANGFAHSGISTGSSIALDPSGNVWIGNNTTPGNTVNQDSVFEIVGAAVPTVTPIALALKNGTIAQRP
jgi:hypothetical protein